MNIDFHQLLIEKSPIGYAYHKIICHSDGKPCDYEFIEINPAYENLCGLKRQEIVGRRATQIFSHLKNRITFYGDLALKGGQKELEHYSESQKKWYKIVAYSPQKYYFVTLVIDITAEKQQVINLRNLQTKVKEIERKYVTHSKQTEEALHFSQRQLSDIIEFLPDATLAINKDKQVIIWNKAIEKMTGIPASEMIGKGDYAYSVPFYGTPRPQLMNLVFGEELSGADASRYQALTREGGTIEAEVFCPALYNNKGAWVYTRTSPLHDQAGNIIGAIESVRDITERKLFEESLQEKTAFLEAQINSSLDGIVLDDADFRRIYTNNKYYEMLNVPQHIIDAQDDSALLEYLKTLIPEKYTKKFTSLYHQQRLYETSFQEIELKNGKILEQYSAPVIDKNGKYYGRVWTFHDITDRKRLEIDLAREKNLLETTLLSVGDGVISTDNNGKIVLLNKVAEELTGWKQEEAKGKPIEEVFVIHNELTNEKCDNIVEKVLKSGKTRELANHTILYSKDGTTRTIEDSAAPIIQENGNIVGVVLVFRDFTEKKLKQKEIEYLSYHDQLTGLYNRRFYEEQLLRLDTKRNLPLTVIMGDVNGLKLVNDSFGHAMGDVLLQKVAKVLQKGCRYDDIIARYGGDEFVIILPKTNSEEAEKIIKRINDLAAQKKAGSMAISISFGYATKNNELEDIQAILKNSEDRMYRNKLYESSSIRSRTIDLILNTLYEKSKREMFHSRRVSEICETLAIKMDFDKEDINQIRIAGLMHDIGKIGIEEKILNKPNKLNQEERYELIRHVEIGYRILSSVNEFSEIANHVLEHHERWDGSGYPKGLKGEEISLQARIIAIADSFDAMTTDRPYRGALNEQEAIKELKRCSGTQFDPEIVKIFIENFKPDSF